MAAPTPARALVLGLDGATFDYIDPLVARGELPHLGALLARGARGVLQSTVPPLSPVAWPTFYTGLNPGRHGVFWWTVPDPQGRLVPVNRTHVRGAALWQHFNRLGRPVIVNGMPISFPPDAVDGCLIAGWDSPGEPSAGIRPPEWRTRLERRFGPLRLTVPEGASNPLDAWLAMEAQRAAITRHLLQTIPWGLAVHVFAATDHFNHPIPGLKAGDLERAYAAVDAMAGTLLECAGDETLVVVVSDHGSMRHRRLLALNAWLCDRGTMAWKPEVAAETVGDYAAKFARRRRWNPDRWRGRAQKIWRSLPGPLRRRAGDWIRRAVRYDLTEIDAGRSWAHTRTVFGEIFIDEDAGRRMLGLDRGGLRKRATELLLSIRDPETGGPFFTGVRPREAVFNGPHVAGAADLYPVFAHPADQVEPFRWARGNAVFRTHKGVSSGDHTPEGIGIFAGPGVRPGARFESGALVDALPTMLHALGLEVPSDLDGRVLDAVFEVSRAVRPGPAMHGASPAAPSPVAEDDEDVRDRLRALGYL